jgi:hypothetical protein
MLFKRKTEPVKQPKEHIRHDAAEAEATVRFAGAAVISFYEILT